MLGHDTIQDIKNVKNRIGTQYFNITDIIVVDVAADVVMLLLLLLSLLLLLFDTDWSSEYRLSMTRTWLNHH